MPYGSIACFTTKPGQQDTGDGAEAEEEVVEGLGGFGDSSLAARYSEHNSLTVTAVTAGSGSSSPSTPNTQIGPYASSTARLGITLPASSTMPSAWPPGSERDR
jgi:hypothetical protein